MREDNNTKKKARAHLDDFVVSEDGSYVYRGITYTFVGDASVKRKSYARVALLSAFAILSTVLCGCIPAAGMDNCFYMLVPYLLQVIAEVVLATAVFRLLTSKEPLKTYVYKKTAYTLADKAIFNAITPLLCLVATAVYLLLNGFEGKVWGSILYILLNCTVAALSYMLYKLAESFEYEKHLPASQREEE